MWQKKQWRAADGQDAIRHTVLLADTPAVAGALSDAIKRPAEAGRHRATSIGELIDLVRSINASKLNGQSVHLDVIVSGVPAVSGLLKTLAAEQPWLNCRLIDVTDYADVLPALNNELAGDRADAEVRLRANGRFVPRLELAAVHDASGAIPFKQDGRYVINGGGDGIGRELEGYLAGVFNAKVLRLPGDQPAAIAGRIAEFEAEHGAVSGVMHISAAHRERALLDETAESLATELLADVDGCRQLAEVARSRPDCLFVAFTSATGFFGGATAGATATSAASVTAIADELHASTNAPCYTFAWSMWSHQAEGAGESTLARASGFHPVSLKQGLVSFLCPS